MNRLTEAHAAALLIAERKLIALGWKWDAKALGIYAAEILLEMESKIEACRAALHQEATDV